MAAPTSDTGSLTAVMQTYYDKVFLQRAEAELRHDFGAQVKMHQPNQGKTINFTRFAPLTAATTALTEGTANPTDSTISATTVAATLAHYGAFTRVSDLFSMTSIDDNLKEHIEVHGQNAGETVDVLIRTEMFTGATAQLAGGNTLLTAVLATDVFSGAEIRKAVRALKTNKARKFPGGMFRGVTQPYAAYDLFGNSEWLDAHRYTTSDAIERGVIGKLHGVEFVETNQGKTQSSTVTVYSNFIFGQNAYAIVKMSSFPQPKVIVKNPGSGDTSNPLDIYSTIGWKVPFVCKTLNSKWLIDVQSGATA